MFKPNRFQKPVRFVIVIYIPELHLRLRLQL